MVAAAKIAMDLQNLLTKDSDKLTQAKELEQMENVIKQITNQLKKVKQESHFQLLELQKTKDLLDESKFESGKIQKENEFLQNRVESLELEKQELVTKSQLGEDVSFRNDDNDLAEMEEGDNKTQ